MSWLSESSPFKVFVGTFARALLVRLFSLSVPVLEVTSALPWATACISDSMTRSVPALTRTFWPMVAIALGSDHKKPMAKPNEPRALVSLAPMVPLSSILALPNAVLRENALIATFPEPSISVRESLLL